MLEEKASNGSHGLQARPDSGFMINVGNVG